MIGDVDIDIRIDRFRLSWSRPRDYWPPKSARQLEDELAVVEARCRHAELQNLDAIDILRRALRGEPEDRPSPHASKCAVELIGRLRAEVQQYRDRWYRCVDEHERMAVALAQVANAVGVETHELDDLTQQSILDKVICGARSLRARTAPLAKWTA